MVRFLTKRGGLKLTKDMTLSQRREAVRKAVARIGKGQDFFVDEESSLLNKEERQEKPEEISQAMVPGEAKKGPVQADDIGLLEGFKPLGKYLGQNGTLDANRVKTDYRKFLQKAPKENRMYLEQSLDAVEFDMRDGLPAAFGYETTKDKFLYDPKHPAFGIYDLGVALTHELSHRIDKFFVRSWKDKKFAKAIRAAEKIVDADPDMFVRFCTEKDEEGFCSDILSAISKNKYKFPAGHKSNYWRAYTQAREIFANLYSLQTYQDAEKLEFLRSHFPELMARFEALDFYIA